MYHPLSGEKYNKSGDQKENINANAAMIQKAFNIWMNDKPAGGVKASD